MENIIIDRGLPGTKAGMSSSVNDDGYTVVQRYRFVKKIDREDGGLKYTAEFVGTVVGDFLRTQAETL